MVVFQGVQGVQGTQMVFNSRAGCAGPAKTASRVCRVREWPLGLWKFDVMKTSVRPKSIDAGKLDDLFHPIFHVPTIFSDLISLFNHVSYN